MLSDPDFTRITLLHSKETRKRIPHKMVPLRRLLCAAAAAAAARPFSSAAPEVRTQRLQQIADDLLSLTEEERKDYSILFRLRLGLHNLVQSGAGFPSAAPGQAAEAASVVEEKEKTAFDIKLEKFDAAAKIKIIKEVRTFTDLGLKEAKELVEKAPVVLKTGVTKEEAEAIAAKLKAVGATIALE
ncbi:uncharacterized protein LOC141841898 [Curcuma longa]|uniref:uncharacterized protein LOC141841898 n=1 Tax=Curcuma longa TaxID=136217 RepID=UPI003D9E79A1